MKRKRRVRPWPRVSTFLMDNLSGAILGDPELEADPPGVLKRACASCDAAVVAEHPGSQHPLGNPGPGSTAIVVLLLPPRMFVANVGDSRAIAADGEGEVVFQSVDQRPSRPEERARILELGGAVRDVDGELRAEGILAMSRAFGNAGIKHCVKVRRCRLNPG
jgi:protein phosphatase 1L